MVFSFLIASDCLEAVSALTEIAGVLITLLAVVVALFGEQWRKYLMRPHLSVSCGTAGALFRSHDELEGVWTIHLSVVNSGKSSAKNVHCVLQSVREWNGSKWMSVGHHFPSLLTWSLYGDSNLQTLPPNSSSLLTFAYFINPERSHPQPYLKLRIEGGFPYSGGRRYQFEIIINSDDDVHYHGFIETIWDASGNGSHASFAISETRQA